MKRALCTLLILLLTAAVPALAENTIPKAGDETILLRVLRAEADRQRPPRARIVAHHSRPSSHAEGRGECDKKSSPVISFHAEYTVIQHHCAYI